MISIFFSSIGNEVTSHYGPTVLTRFPSQTSKRFGIPKISTILGPILFLLYILVIYKI